MIHSNLSVYIYRAAFLILFSMVLNGCNRERNNPGWDYFPDMFYSTAYETFSKNPNFNNGMTMREPVPGTVARDFIPFDYTIDPESRIKAGMELVNPFFPTSDILVRGKEVYTVFCSECHGIKGDGEGYLFTSGLYSLKPKTLNDSTVGKLKDGEIFHTITLGLGFMGAHGSQIGPDDRWKVVLYIRELHKEAPEVADIGKGK